MFGICATYPPGQLLYWIQLIRVECPVRVTSSRSDRRLRLCLHLSSDLSQSSSSESLSCLVLSIFVFSLFLHCNHLDLAFPFPFQLIPSSTTPRQVLEKVFSIVIDPIFPILLFDQLIPLHLSAQGRIKRSYRISDRHLHQLH